MQYKRLASRLVLKENTALNADQCLKIWDLNRRLSKETSDLTIKAENTRMFY
jgi:hypothetical protein